MRLRDRSDLKVHTGMLLAEESLYITITAVLSTMDISPIDNKQPSEIEFTQGVIRFDNFKFLPASWCHHV